MRAKTEMKPTYFIREKWAMTLGTEIYNEDNSPVNEVHSLPEVKAFIKDWISTWKDNAKENGYTFDKESVATDYKTFADLDIETESGTDKFHLIVVDAKHDDGTWKGEDAQKEEEEGPDIDEILGDDGDEE